MAFGRGPLYARLKGYYKLRWFYMAAFGRLLPMQYAGQSSRPYCCEVVGQTLQPIHCGWLKSPFTNVAASTYGMYNTFCVLQGRSVPFVGTVLPGTSKKSAALGGVP